MDAFEQKYACHHSSDDRLVYFLFFFFFEGLYFLRKKLVYLVGEQLGADDFPGGADTENTGSHKCQSCYITEGVMWKRKF